MLAFLISLFAILGFILALKYLNIVPVSREAIVKARVGVLAILDSRLTEEEKEAAVQTAGLALLRFSVEIFWRLAACLLAAAAPIYLFSWLLGVAVDEVLHLMLRWDYILCTTVVLSALAWWHVRFRGHAEVGSAYSSADQLVHKLAFSGPGIQLTACDIEDRFFAGTLKAVVDRPPIFITSLPRAGTTVLLTALNDLPGAATHLYRDMPFVMSPLLWSKISGLFVKPNETKERAHGDGIQVGYDSPEAFEEVIWKSFWPEKYSGAMIDLWQSEDVLPEASAFFIQHFRKIVSLRASGQGRYLSKNNANIARLDLLRSMFPGSQVIIPVRDPAEHAASLFRQHQNFLQQHAEDPFVARYMEDIGHLEFGALHKPFAFPGFEASQSLPEDPNYWLEYWVAAYQMVLERSGHVHFVSQSKLSSQPETVLGSLCEILELPRGGVELSHHFRSVPARSNSDMFDQSVLLKAKVLYQDMCAKGV